VVGHSSDDLGVRGLDEQRPDAADEGGGVTDNGPGDRIGPTQTGISRYSSVLASGYGA
jgi:hypothetical protein